MTKTHTTTPTPTVFYHGCKAQGSRPIGGKKEEEEKEMKKSYIVTFIDPFIDFFKLTIV